jgi:hypothetical protein
MAKTTSKSASFAKGGKTKMFSRQNAGTQKPGTTAHSTSGGGKFAKGGSGHMFGKQSASPARGGYTAKC